MGKPPAGSPGFNGSLHVQHRAGETRNEIEGPVQKAGLKGVLKGLKLGVGVQLIRSSGRSLRVEGNPFHERCSLSELNDKERIAHPNKMNKGNLIPRQGTCAREQGSCLCLPGTNISTEFARGPHHRLLGPLEVHTTIEFF